MTIIKMLRFIVDDNKEKVVPLFFFFFLNYFYQIELQYYHTDVEFGQGYFV